MTVAQFSLVNKVPVDILRHELNTRVNGHVVEGAQSTVTIMANVHPFSDYQVMMLPESDRTKSWMWLFTSDMVRSKREGSFGPDRFYWDGDLYEIMATQKFSMSVSDHFEAKCARVELSPN